MPVRSTTAHSSWVEINLPLSDSGPSSGTPKSVTTMGWLGLAALALVGVIGSSPCPKSQMLQSIRLMPMI